MMARLNTSKSRRSPASDDSKLVFDDEKPPIILSEQIMPDDDWVVVNQKLKSQVVAGRMDTVSFHSCTRSLVYVKSKENV